MAAPDGTDEFRRAARVLRAAADSDLRKQVYAAFRRAAKPLGEQVIREGSAALPRRGGLSARIAKSRMGQSNSIGANPSVALRFRSVQGYDLGALDRGMIRHPVFARPGRARKWVRQPIRSNSFTRPFEAGAEPVRQEVLAALQAVADQIAAESRG